MPKHGIGLGQPFGPPTPPHMAYHGPPPPPPSYHGPKRNPINHGPKLGPINHGPNNHGPLNHGGPVHSSHINHGPHPNHIPQQQHAASEISEKLYGAPLSGNDLWSAPVPDMPKIVSLDVKCEKQGMKVFLQFDKPFYGIVFSKGTRLKFAHPLSLMSANLPLFLQRPLQQYKLCPLAG